MVVHLSELLDSALDQEQDVVMEVVSEARAGDPVHFYPVAAKEEYTDIVDRLWSDRFGLIAGTQKHRPRKPRTRTTALH